MDEGAKSSFALVFGHEDAHLCLRCRGITLPASPLGENHIAVRFENHHRPDGAYSAAYLDGKDVSNNCSEAFAARAPNGWAVLYCAIPNKHACLCMEGVCQFIARGDVRIETRPHEPSHAP